MIDNYLDPQTDTTPHLQFKTLPSFTDETVVDYTPHLTLDKVNSIDLSQDVPTPTAEDPQQQDINIDVDWYNSQVDDYNKDSQDKIQKVSSPQDVDKTEYVNVVNHFNNRVLEDYNSRAKKNKLPIANSVEEIDNEKYKGMVEADESAFVKAANLEDEKVALRYGIKFKPYENAHEATILRKELYANANKIREAKNASNASEYFKVINDTLAQKGMPLYKTKEDAVKDVKYIQQRIYDNDIAKYKANVLNVTNPNELFASNVPSYVRKGDIGAVNTAKENFINSGLKYERDNAKQIADVVELYKKRIIPEETYHAMNEVSGYMYSPSATSELSTYTNNPIVTQNIGNDYKKLDNATKVIDNSLTKTNDNYNLYQAQYDAYLNNIKASGVPPTEEQVAYLEEVDRKKNEYATMTKALSESKLKADFQKLTLEGRISDAKDLIEGKYITNIAGDLVNSSIKSFMDLAKEVTVTMASLAPNMNMLPLPKNVVAEAHKKFIVDLADANDYAKKGVIDYMHGLGVSSEIHEKVQGSIAKFTNGIAGMAAPLLASAEMEGLGAINKVLSTALWTSTIYGESIVDVLKDDKYKGVPLSEIKAMTFIPAVVQGLIMSKGLKFTKTDLQSATYKIMRNMMAESAPNIGYDGVMNLARKNTAEFLARVGSNAAHAGVTGLSTSVVNDVGRNASNYLLGKDVDISPSEILSNGIHSAGQWMLTGLFLSAIPTAVAIHTENKVNAEQFGLALDMVQTPTRLSFLTSKIKDDVTNGRIDKSEAELQMASLKSLYDVGKQIPKHLVPEAKYEAFKLLREKNVLEQQIGGLNEILATPMRERVKEIDSKLLEISKDENSYVKPIISKKQGKAIDDNTTETIKDNGNIAITNNTNQNGKIKEANAQTNEGQDVLTPNDTVGGNSPTNQTKGSVVGGEKAKPTFENVPILTRTAEEIETAKNEVFNNLSKLEVGSVIENSDGEIKVVTEKSTDKKGNQLIGVVTYERQSDGSLRQMTNIVWASKSADGKIKLDYNPHSTGTNSKGERVTVTDQITDKKIDLSKENIFTQDENGNLIQINKVEQSLKETPEASSVSVGGDVEIKNEGKADAPTKESVIERLNINNPFYKKVEDALVKLGLIEKYNPETRTGDVVGGYLQEYGEGGFAAGDMYFKADGSISYVKGDNIVTFDKNGNVISENTKEAKQKAVSLEIEGKKESIASLEKIRDSEAFKYKEVTETDVLGNKKKVKRLKTSQELKESTDKINEAINKGKAELSNLEQSLKETPQAGSVGVEGDVENADITNVRKAKTKSEVEAAILKATQSDNLKDGLDAAENLIGKAMYKSVFYADPVKFGNELADAIEKIVKKQQSLKETPEAGSGGGADVVKEPMGDNELQQIVGRDVFKQIQRSEEQLGEGVVDRNRMIETAKRIQKADKKDKLLPEHIFEALQYETGYPDNWQDLRNAIKKGGIDINSEAVQRQIEVGVDLPKDIVEEFKKSERYKNATPELKKAVEQSLNPQPKAETQIETTNVGEVELKGIVDDTNIEIKKNEIEGGLLNEQQSLELQKEIESNYIDSGVELFGLQNQDIRMALHNYDNPLAEKDVNGVNLRIASGLLEVEKDSDKKRPTYLLYADGKIVGKFYSVSDTKKVVKFIEDNLVKNVGEVKVEPSKVESNFTEFENAVKESKTVKEAFDKVQAIKNVPSEVSQAFKEKYDAENKLTPKQAFKKFYDEVKSARKSKVVESKVEQPTKEQPNDYYIKEGKEFIKVDNAKPVKLDVDGDFFAVKGDNGFYTIYEGTSGQAIARDGKLLKDAIKNANEKIAKYADTMPIKKAIKSEIDKDGISPRYKAVDQPNTESKVNVGNGKQDTKVEQPTKEVSPSSIDKGEAVTTIGKEIPKSEDGLYQIYTIKIKDRKTGEIEDAFAVPNYDNREGKGMGDSIHKTLSDAIEQVKLNREDGVKREQRNKELQSIADKNAQDIADSKKANEGKTPLQIANEAKANKTLDTKIRVNGVEKTKRNHIEDVLSEGGHTETAEVNVIKDPTRTAYNRMDGRQQEAFEKRQKEAGKKTEYRLFSKDGSFIEINKTEYNYANSLKEGKQDTKVELTDKQKAKAKLDEARLAFRKAGGLSSGGYEALPEFLKLVKAYAEFGYESVKEAYNDFKKDFPTVNIEQDKFEKHYNDAMGSQKVDAKENIDNEADKSGGEKTIGVSHEKLNQLATKLGLPEVPRGTVLTPKEYADRGRLLIKNGVDPLEIAQQFKNDGLISADRISVVRAHLENLEKERNRIGDDKKFGAKSEEYKKAEDAVKDWYENVVKPMGTEWGASGQTLQGERDLDTDSFTAIRNATEKIQDSPINQSQEKKIRELTDKNELLTKQFDELHKKNIEITDKAFNKKAQDTSGVFKQKAKKLADKFRDKLKSKPLTFKDKDGNDIVVKMYGANFNAIIELGAKAIELSGDVADGIKAIADHLKEQEWYKKLTPENKDVVDKQVRDYFSDIADTFKKPLTEAEQLEELQKKFIDKKDNKFTFEEGRSIWDYAKKNYLDNGVEWKDMIQNVMSDLGLTWRQVSSAITVPENKSISDAMWKKQSERMRNKFATKDWVEEQNKTEAYKLWKKLSGTFRSTAIFGHGGIFVGTHAGMNLFDRRTALPTIKAMLNAYKLAYGKTASYEMAMEELKNSPNYIPAQRAGLQNNPDRVNNEDYQNSQHFISYIVGKGIGDKISTAGEHGFNAIKVLRQQLFDAEYNKLSPEEKLDKNAVKSIAELVNNGTGATNLNLAIRNKKGEVNFDPNEFLFAAGMEAARWGKLTRNPVKATGIALKATFAPDKATVGERVFAKVWAKRVGNQLAGFTSILLANAALQKITNPNNPVNLTNPDEPDFMKFKFGNRTIDPTSGMRSTAMFIYGLGKIPFMSKEERKGDTPLASLAKSSFQYGRGKLAPLYSTMSDFFLHQDYNKNEMPYSDEKPITGKHKLTWIEYAWQKAPLPVAEAAAVAYKTALENGADKPTLDNILTGIVNGTISGATGFRVSEFDKEEHDKKRGDIFTDLEKENPSLKLFTDKKIKLPTKESLLSEEIPDKALKKKMKISEYSEELQKKYADTYKNKLEQTLSKLQKRNKVFIDDYNNVSLERPRKHNKVLTIDELSSEQLKRVMGLAKSESTTFAKEHVFNRGSELKDIQTRSKK